MVVMKVCMCGSLENPKCGTSRGRFKYFWRDLVE